MVYTKQTWTDLPSETTPISAARLAHLETQYDEVVSAVADPSSDMSTALRPFAFKNANGTALQVTDTKVDGDAGWWNFVATNTTGYMWHMSTATGFTGSGLIGVGVDAASSTGFVLSVKGAGATGIYMDMNETGPTSSSKGLWVAQHSASAPAAVFSHELANSTAALRLASNAVGSSNAAIMDHLASDGTTVWMERRAKDGYLFQFVDAHFGGAATDATTRTNGLHINYGRVSAETELRLYRQASGTPTWYAHRIYTVSSELRLGSSATGATVDGTETTNDLIRMRADGGVPRIGFLGVAPVTRVTFAAATGTKTRTTFATSTVTLPQLAERVAALIDDLGTTSGVGLLTA